MKANTASVPVSKPTKDDLVIMHEPLVKRIAFHLMNRLPPSVQADDLIQAGMIGLIEAAKNFDPDQGASFETYAGIRIENREGRDARDVEVAREMGIGLNEYHKILQDATGCRIFSFEDPASLGEEGFTSTERQSNQPYENLQKENFKAGLAEAIKGLPERERLVMALYYDEELNLREIGEILGVSESRVCQIHGQSLIRLRARMEEWLKD
jgi:RNA polymerase sigma factor for flagellar operon FliA